MNFLTEVLEGIWVPKRKRRNRREKRRNQILEAPSQTLHPIPRRLRFSRLQKWELCFILISEVLYACESGSRQLRWAPSWGRGVVRVLPSLCTAWQGSLWGIYRTHIGTQITKRSVLGFCVLCVCVCVCGLPTSCPFLSKLVYSL